MRLLLTGASSFTGYWFARALCEAGHEVVAPLFGGAERYREGARSERVHRLADCAEIVWDCPFGSERFLGLVARPGWDALCHHAAQVGDYRSLAFDVVAALAANTRNLAPALRCLAEGGARALILTGSVFEQGEGAGTLPLRAFSPYGVSKGLTASVAEHYAAACGLGFGKFVIPNPFGPLEEPRFCAYLLRSWQAGETPTVRTPSYVRDNIPVDLLARAYARFVAACVSHGAGQDSRSAPSGYVESQGQFAARLASEIRHRSGLACALHLARQTDWSEPVVRINTESVLASGAGEGWNEAGFWDALAESYRLR